MLTFWYYFAVFPRRISVVEREPHACRVRLLAKAFGVAQRRRAFTLLEMLVVMGIIAILMVLVAPAFTNLKSAGDVTNAVYGIQGLLDNARTYAKANNTYVFVGFAEVDVTPELGKKPVYLAGFGKNRLATEVLHEALDIPLHGAVVPARADEHVRLVLAHQAFAP